MGAGAQTQGREGVSLGKGSQDPTTHFFSRTTMIQTPPQTRPQQFIATLSHWLLPKSLTWDPSAHSGSSESPVSRSRNFWQQQVPFLPLPSPGSSAVWLQLPSA